MAYANGYTYRRSITVDYTKVPNTNQTDFPVLISGTYSYLAHTTHAGLVTDLTGYDIAFYSDAAGTTPLYWEIETYNHETGAIVFWVKATLSYVADTVFYMFYTNASVSTFQSTAASVWNANFMGVWHLKEAGGVYADSTSNANNGASTTEPSATAGQIDGAQSYTSNYNNITAPADSTLDLSTYTLSIWFNSSDFGGGWDTLFTKKNQPTYQVYRSNYKIQLYDNAATIDDLATITSGTHHFVLVESAGTLYPYLDGAALSTVTRTSHFSTNGVFIIGNMGTTDAWSGILDEMRVSDSVRSADWIATEYANQNAPSTFYLVGSQTESSAYIETYGGTMTGILRGEFRGMMKRLS